MYDARRRRSPPARGNLGGVPIRIILFIHFFALYGQAQYLADSSHRFRRRSAARSLFLTLAEFMSLRAFPEVSGRFGISGLDHSSITSTILARRVVSPVSYTHLTLPTKA